MEKIYSVWNHKQNFNDKGLNITLQGDAWSARYSGFWINEWGAMFDAGLQSNFNIEHLFISHTHSDHIFQLYSLLKNIENIPKVYVPYGTKAFVKNYILSMRRLSSLSKTNYLGCELMEVNPGDVFKIIMKKLVFGLLFVFSMSLVSVAANQIILADSDISLTQEQDQKKDDKKTKKACCKKADAKKACCTKAEKKECKKACTKADAKKACSKKEAVKNTERISFRLV